MADPEGGPRVRSRPSLLSENFGKKDKNKTHFEGGTHLLCKSKLMVEPPLSKIPGSAPE